MNEVLDFISRFTNKGRKQEVIESFTCGCCYWFAHILCNRFPNAIMMYDLIDNHFVTLINGRLYDITGDVTGQYKVIVWDDYDDELHKQRIVNDCINF